MKISYNIRAIQYRLLFITSFIGATMVATYFFGFIIGLLVNLFIFMLAVLYIRRILFSGNTDNRRSDAGFNPKVNYVCLSCGSNSTGIKCPKCGSKLKKAVFGWISPRAVAITSGLMGAQTITITLLKGIDIKTLSRTNIMIVRRGKAAIWWMICRKEKYWY